MDWNNEHVEIKDIYNWIRHCYPDSKDAVGPIEIYRSNDWGITAKFKVLFEKSEEKEIVFKVGFLPIFQTSIEIYKLLNRLDSGSVPKLINGEFRDNKTWLIFEVFRGESVRQDVSLKPLVEIASSMAEIQIGVNKLLEKYDTPIPKIEVAGIGEFLDILIEKYEKEWKHSADSISKELNISYEKYEEIFIKGGIDALKDKIHMLSEELDRLMVPYSIDHLDLHSGNAVKTAKGNVLIYDWEEAVVSCPIFSLDKIMDEAGKLDDEKEKLQGLWTESQKCIRDTYLSTLRFDNERKMQRAFDVAMCIAPVKYAYQSTFFIEQVGWNNVAPILIGDSIVKAYDRCRYL